MAIAKVASVSAGSSDGDSITTGAIDTTGATLLVVGVAYYDLGAAPTLTDSKSNSWNGLTIQDVDNGQPALRIYYAENPTVGSGHTFTLTGSAAFPSVAAIAYSGAATSSPADQQNGAAETGTVTSLQPGSVTPSEDNEVVVTVLGIDDGGTSQTINGGFTIQESVDFGPGVHFGIRLADLIQTTATAANPTWSWTSVDQATAAIATFLSAAGGGVPTDGRILIAPVGFS